jgi:hypothetical protein
MPNYECKVCNFSSKIKCNYLTHLKTKKHLNKVKAYGNALCETLQNPPISLQNPPILGNQIKINQITNNSVEHLDNGEYNCEYCGKRFSRQDNLKRHMDFRCKEKKKNDEEILFKNLYQKEIQEKQIAKEAHQKQVEMLLEKVGTTTINNNNCGNTQTNNQNNIQLNNFGQENLDMLTDKYMRKMVIYPYTAIPKMIKKIHFNDNFPENKNIRMLNKKDNKLQIRNNDKWEYVNKKETLESLINDKNYQLDKYYEENRDSFEYKYQSRFDTFQEKIGDEDKHVNKEINTGSELVFWNNM